MRLLVESDLKPAGGIVGAGVRRVPLAAAGAAGRRAARRSEVLEVRPSKSRPEQGMMKLRTTTLNQRNEPVQISVGNLVVPRRLREMSG